MKALKQKLEHHSHIRNVSVDNNTSEGLAQLLQQYYSQQALRDKDEESFHATFWKHQLKILTLMNKKHIRWDPLIIRWALYLHHRSSGAYKMLRESGIIKLPSSQTLHDYRHLSISQLGFSTIAKNSYLTLFSRLSRGIYGNMFSSFRCSVQ